MKLSLTINPDGATSLDLETDYRDHPQLVQQGYNQFLWIGERMTNVPMTPIVQEAGNGRGPDGLPEASAEVRHDRTQEPV